VRLPTDIRDKGDFLTNPTGFGRVESLGSHTTAARAEITPLVSDRLREVEALLRRNLASPVEIVDEIGQFVNTGVGKRVRPTLHLLCVQLCEYEGPHDVLLATVVELIHCATLIHDDIIDEATTRRGRESVNHRWGNDVTVLFGDYMFAKAMQLAIRAGSLPVLERLADTTLRMTEGEMLQTRYVGRIDLTVEEYLAVLERKTAALFSCCCELAGILAEVDEEREARLRGYGRHLGLAFQIVDDLLDFTGDPARLGKPTASDLREGKATLAVLDLLSCGSGTERRLVRGIMDGTHHTGAVARLTGLMHESGAIERAHERARFHALSAIGELRAFPESPARRALHSLPDLLLFRDR
jgi:octaprenyl-diphosphate synthase